MYMGVLTTCVVYHVHAVPLVSEEQKRVLDSQDLEIQMIVSYHAKAKN